MKQKSNVLFLVIVIAALAIGAVIYYKSSSSQPESTKSAEQTKTFQSSSVMKFTIELPINYKANEKFGSVTINTDTRQILIGQNGTNFNNLQDYIKNSRNNLDTRLTNRKNLKINGLDATFGFIGEERIYLIYAENTVYSISTKSSSLFDDLDQIAQTFRYTP